MQDRNAKAPKVRSGEEINPVLGTIIKISALVVIAALVVLTTLIIIEFVKLNKKTENDFKDRIHITVSDFEIITTGLSHDDLSTEVKEIMELVNEDDDIYFFFYYSDTLKDVNKDIRELVKTREEKARIFLIDLNIKQQEDENGNKIPTIIDYLKTVEELNPSSSGVEFDTLIERKDTYNSFLMVFNEDELNNNRNPYKLLTNIDPIKTEINKLLEAEKKD